VSYVAFVALAVVALWGMAAMFACGVWAAVEILKTFELKWDEKAARRVSMALQEQARKQIERRQVVERFKQTYGELPAEHEAALTEEIENVLSAGPTRRSS